MIRFRQLQFPASLLLLAVTAAAAADSGANPRVYEAIPGESEIAYHLQHTTHKVKGVSRDFTCRVELAPDTVSSKVMVSADVRKFDSGNSSRDDHALAAIRATRHPRVEFASDSVRAAPGGAWRVFGRLSFAGTTRPMDFLVVPKEAPGKVGVTGGFRIRLSDYGVKPPGFLFLKVQDEMDVRFEVAAKE